MNDVEFPVFVGRCIYCGGDDGTLTDEHVIPFALNGTWKLLKASCDRHSAVTKRFENVVLRGAFLAPRAKLGIRTRRPRNRPDRFPLTVNTSAGETEIQLRTGDHPAFMTFPIYGKPGHAPIDGPTPGLEVTGFKALYHTPSYTRLQQEMALKSVTFPFPDVTAFAQMLAKIGYCFAVARLGVDSVMDSPIVPVILGNIQDAGLYLGNDGGEPRNSATGVHEATLSWTDDTVIAYVRLFAILNAPEYTVILRQPVGPAHHQG